MAGSLKPENDFVAKHWQRIPEWQLAAGFLPADSREQQLDYLALQNEWWLARAIADETPRVAKLAWWAEELRGWSRGMRRHPLGAQLHSASAHWDAVADALTQDSTALLAKALSEVDAEILGIGTPHALLQTIVAMETALLAVDEAAEWPSNRKRPAGPLPRLRAMQYSILAARSANARHTVALSPLRALLISWNAARKSK
ncbi:hypothetical protein [Aquilutibacter rugosus]|uniref:hypothetical protein n=1 Tax=Aquilutibacter rugosus TaxID=3115820 RepID=UPI002F430021